MKYKLLYLILLIFCIVNFVDNLFKIFDNHLNFGLIKSLLYFIGIIIFGGELLKK